jgi:cytidylate kinase
VIEEAVQAGPAVLVGRGAQCMLAARADALHVFCYAPAEVLASYVITNFGVSTAEAHRIVAEKNHQREQYVKRYWKRNWRDLANYHLCVNTAWLGLDGAADVVVQLARERFG